MTRHALVIVAMLAVLLLAASVLAAVMRVRLREIEQHQPANLDAPLARPVAQAGSVVGHGGANSTNPEAM